MKPEVEKVEMELFLKGELKTDDDVKEDASGAPAAEAPPAAAGGDAAAPGGDAAAAHTGSTTNVHPWLSSMVNYAQPVHFNGFEAAASKKNLQVVEPQISKLNRCFREKHCPQHVFLC